MAAFRFAAADTSGKEQSGVLEADSARVARQLLRGYVQLGGDPRFLALALASGVPFNGMFLYVLSAPVFLGTHLGLGQWQFTLMTFAMMQVGGLSGASWAARLKRNLAPFNK